MARLRIPLTPEVREILACQYPELTWKRIPRKIKKRVRAEISVLMVQAIMDALEELDSEEKAKVNG